MRAILLLPFLAAVAVAQPADDPLGALADALGGRDRIDALETVHVESRTRVTIGSESHTLRSTLDLRLPDTARWTARFGGASQVTWLDGASASTVVGDSVSVLPRAARTQVEAALWLQPLVLAARRSELSAERLADDLIRVVVPGRQEALLIGLNANGRPSRITTFRRREGRRDYLEIVLRDYREVDGVFIPHRIRQAVRGQVTGEETITSVAFDVPLEGAPFQGGAD